MNSALIGHTGFVGSNLARQHPFTRRYHSRNIDEIRGGEFDLVVCAGVQAKKWWANQHPAEDWAGIERLLGALAQVQAKTFVLISTIDVYPVPRGVDEDSPIEPNPSNPYGVHRLKVEERVRERFPSSTIIRLPALFGTGLRKNVIYDLLHDNLLDQINPASTFQYYYLHRLWPDVERCLSRRIELVNFATEPVSTHAIHQRFFPAKAIGQKAAAEARYDFRTRHDVTLGGGHGYLYDAATVLGDLAGYLTEESTAP